MIDLRNVSRNLNPFPFFIIENALPNKLATEAQKEILNIPDERWDRYDNPFEKKFTLRDKNNLPEAVKKTFDYLTSEHFLMNLSKVYNIKLYNDPNKNWWGIHKYKHGDKLDIHVDAGLHPVTEQKKQVTLGIYLSRDWTEENGGHLELWEGENSSFDNAKLKCCKKKILPTFNKLITFECNDFAWHGNPMPVKCDKGETRIFLTLSYVSENYTDLNNRHKAFFIKLPDEPENEEKDRLRLLRADKIKCKKTYRYTL